MLDRPPPFAEAAERGILGAMLQDSMTVMDICLRHGVEHEAFYIPAHVRIFHAFEWMREKGEAIDALTLLATLKMKRGALEAVGGAEYINAMLLDSMVTSVETYIEQVMQAWKARKGIVICRDVEQRLYSDDAHDAIARALHDFGTLSEMGNQGTVTTRERWSDVKQQALDVRAGKRVGIPMPWPILYDVTGGWPKGVVSLLLGQSESRKSFAANQACVYASVLCDNPAPGAYYPFEDGPDLALKRAACIIAGVDAWRVLRGRVTDDELERLEIAAQRIIDSPFHISALKGSQLPKIRMEAMSLVSKMGLEYLWFDAFKDMGSTNGDIKKEIALIQWGHDLARDTGAAVIFNQHVKKNRTGNRPVKDKMWERITKFDSKGAGAITETSRMTLALQCQYVASEHGGKKYGHYVLECLGNNHGQTGAISLDVDEGTGVFTESSRIPFSDWVDEQGRPIQRTTPWRRQPVCDTSVSAEDDGLGESLEL